MREWRLPVRFGRVWFRLRRTLARLALRVASREPGYLTTVLTSGLYMATTVEGIISDLLLARVGTITGSYTTYYPGLGKPEASKPAATYLVAQLIPNETVSDFIANDSSNRHQGFLQVDVVAPKNMTGIVPPMEVAGAVVSHFKRGTEMASGGVTIRIDRQPYVSPPIEEADRIRVPVSIAYRSFNAAA